MMFSQSQIIGQFLMVTRVYPLKDAAPRHLNLYIETRDITHDHASLPSAIVRLVSPFTRREKWQVAVKWVDQSDYLLLEIPSPEKPIYL